MKNNWSNKIANRYVKKYKKLGFSKDLALRVYTTRLLGRNPELVLHGGGNTSVKTTINDIDGKKYNVLCVKGSGWDMADIEPPGLPAVKLDPLLSLRKKKYLSDEDMVAFQKRNLIDIKSPNPSVETFLHAFLPYKYVDHTHADAVMNVTNRPGGLNLSKKIFGKKASIVPYVMPGFELALEASKAFETANKNNIAGLIISNTTVDRYKDLHPDNLHEEGGLSGKPLFTKSTTFLALANKIIKHKKYNLYLIAAGGVLDAKSAYAKILCGAHLVQLYSSMTFVGPLIADNILKGLLQLMNRDKISSINDIRGIVDNPEAAMKIANDGIIDLSLIHISEPTRPY